MSPCMAPAISQYRYNGPGRERLVPRLVSDSLLTHRIGTRSSRMSVTGATCPRYASNSFSWVGWYWLMTAVRYVPLCEAPVPITFVGWSPPNGQVVDFPQPATAFTVWAKMSCENASPG